jgi:hypothetical protein
MAGFNVGNEKSPHYVLVYVQYVARVYPKKEP